jgi:hypothetical protein
VLLKRDVGLLKALARGIHVRTGRLLSQRVLGEFLEFSPRLFQGLVSLGRRCAGCNQHGQDGTENESLHYGLRCRKSGMQSHLTRAGAASGPCGFLLQRFETLADLFRRVLSGDAVGSCSRKVRIHSEALGKIGPGVLGKLRPDWSRDCARNLAQEPTDSE